MEPPIHPPQIIPHAARLLPTATDTPVLQKSKHITYWLRCLRSPLPHQYTSNDSNRMTLAFFTVSALDLLGVLFSKTTKEERNAYVSWIHRCQHPEGGFRAFPGTDFGEARGEGNEVWDPANVPATYFALGALCVLRDDLGGVKRRECLRWLRRMQREDGSFGQTIGREGVIEGGKDTRFGYCAMVVRWILRGDVRGEVEDVGDVDMEGFVKCVGGSETFDFGFADEPFHEAHAGFTYCALGALQIAGRVALPRCAQQSSSGISMQDQRAYPSLPDLTLRWLMSRITTFVEEEQPGEDDETDGEVDSHHSDDLSTASEALQTSNSSYADPASKYGPANGEAKAPSFEKLGSRPAPVENSQQPPSQLANSENIVHAGSAPPEESGEDLMPGYAGMNGRPDKMADTCYVFWVGASLNILQAHHLIPHHQVRRYLLEKTQNLILGGFGKHPGDLPDLFHAYLGLSALSLLGGADDESTDESGKVRADENHGAMNGQWEVAKPDSSSAENCEIDARGRGDSLDAAALAAEGHCVKASDGLDDRSSEAPAVQPPQAPALSISSDSSTSMSESDRRDGDPNGRMVDGGTSNGEASASKPPKGRKLHPQAIADDTADHTRILRRLDPALCVSFETRRWIESLSFRD